MSYMNKYYKCFKKNYKKARKSPNSRLKVKVKSLLNGIGFKNGMMKKNSSLIKL